MKALASNLHLSKTQFLCLLVVLILMAVLAVSFVQLPTAYSAELAAPEKALMFLEDVVKVDLTKYNVTLVSNWVDYPPHWGGLEQEDVTYDLDGGNESSLYVTCKLREGMLHYCGLEVRKGSPIYAEPQSTNVLDVTQLFLERYRVYSGAEYITGMCNMLDRVDATEIETIKESNVCSSMLPPHSKVVIEDGVMRDIKAITVTEANVKLTITNIVDSYSVEHISFEWTYTVNGLDVTQNVVSVTFEEGVFKSLVNDWDLYNIGSSEVNVSREEAINLARNAAEDYTLRIYLEGGLTDVEFNLADEPARAELFMYPRETLTVYPFWRIDLYFDKFYYSAYGIQVGIWADTGEIESCESLSGLGGPISEQDSTETSTEQNGTASSTNIYLITAAAAIALVAAALLVYFRKTRKTATKPEAIVPEESA
ncbi:MAG TPA: hypothetical protein ENN36_08950 [Candidatus Bathyarchaeota archaeon]|nr:hypothetical protein [Candidatus Bathyarchaeota archaeon]